ncbi:hypothetical protein RAG09_29095 [Klebsiella pneumoniae]
MQSLSEQLHRLSNS